MANEKISDYADATTLSGTELFELVQSGDNVKGSANFLRTFFQVIPVGAAAIFCGNMDLSADTVPVNGGTGVAGAIKKGNFFYINIGSTVLLGPDGGPILSGYIAFARIDTPGASLADVTKWVLIPTIKA